MSRYPDNWQRGERTRIWKALYTTRIPKGYLDAQPDLVALWFAPVLSWKSSAHHGGAGLIGKAGAGKSCAVACLLWTLEQPFV